jgi:hypothetical protein
MTVNIKGGLHLTAGGRAGELAGQSRSPQPSRAQTAGNVDGHVATMAPVEDVEVVVAHNERATLRVGDVFLKIDADQTRTDLEVEAMAMAPIPTPEVLWRKPPALALAALPGTALGRLGEPSTASPAAWAAAGAAVWMLRATAGLPRLHSSHGHQCSRTATCRSATCWSMVTRSLA